MRIWYEVFSKVCRENSRFIKIWRRIQGTLHEFRKMLYRKSKYTLHIKQLFSGKHALYEVKPNRPQVTIQYGACALHAGWLRRTHALSLSFSLVRFNNYCFSTATTGKRTLHNVTLYVHCLSCLIWQLLTSILSSLSSYVHTFYFVLMFLVVYLWKKPTLYFLI